MKKTSLKDIAKKVGVSTAAVSYVLNKGENNKVSRKVADKIIKVAQELNYRPNQIAKSLKLGKTFTIGLVVADISNPFFANIAWVIEDEAKNLNYTVIFGSSDEDLKKFNSLIDVFIDRQVDGFIITPVEGSEKQIKRLIELDIPFVLLDRYFPEINSSYVVIDNFKASYNAISLLIKNGCKKIGMISYKNNLVHMKERVNGYKQALTDFGLNNQKNLIQTVNHHSLRKDVRFAIDQLILKNDAVDGLLFATNKIALQAIKYLNELKIKIPDDLSIVTFDQGEVFDFYYCPVTHIKQPIEDLGKTAIHSLVSQINMENRGISMISLDSELVIKESSNKGVVNPAK